MHAGTGSEHNFETPSQVYIQAFSQSSKPPAMITRFSIVTLVLFFVSTIFVIRPVSFKVNIPRLARPRITLGLNTAPILAIAILWASQCLGATQIRDGIVGTGMFSA